MSGYFDHNATAPMCGAARAAWAEASERSWHNPSGLYRAAAEARRVLEDTRERLAELLDVEPGRIVFTAGATEGNNAVVVHAVRRAKPGALAVTSGIEHPSVSAPLRRWFTNGRVRAAAVSPSGLVDAASVGEALAGSPVALVSVMAANNETGVLQPWEDVAALAEAAGIPYHCDAVQWFGKVGLSGFGACSYVTGSSHKLGGPKGVGFLVVPGDGGGGFAGSVGGPQESGRRGGTEDVAGVVAMVAALEAATPGSPAGRDRFELDLKTRVPGVRILGQESRRLPNTSMVVVPEHKNTKWLTRLDRLGFQLSTGSACSAGRGNPSEVMEAMGLGYDAMGRVLRASGGADTSDADWEALAVAFGGVWEALERGDQSSAKVTL